MLCILRSPCSRCSCFNPEVLQVFIVHMCIEETRYQPLPTQTLEKYFIFLASV